MLYYITLGSFRNMLVETDESVEVIRRTIEEKGWRNPIVKVVEPSRLVDIPPMKKGK